MIPVPIQRCRVCGNNNIEEVLSLGEQSLTGVFPKRCGQPLLSGPLDLVRCVPDGGESCGLLQLRHSYPEEQMYGENYGYRSGLNASMVAHLEAKTQRLLELAKPSPGSIVCDIGCNDGTLLKSYPDSFRRIGIDPVARKFLDFYPEDIEVITDFFSAEAWRTARGGEKASIMTSIAMFYDLEAPLDFVQQVASCLADDGIWHFEQSYMPRMIEQLAYDTICHEHIEYYSLRQIRWLLDHADLKIIALEPSDVNGGSLAVTAAHRNSRFVEASAAIAALSEYETLAGFEGMDPFVRFRERVFTHREELCALVHRQVSEGRKLLGYGASTKGNVLLQFCQFTPAEIPFIGEVNSEKFGCFTPGSGIPIISEAEMHAMKPDVLLVLPWHFRDNLLHRERDFTGRGGRLLFPLPQIGFFPA